MRTTAFVCIHGVGLHESGALAAQVRDCLTSAAENLGGTVVESAGPSEAVTEFPDTAAAPAHAEHEQSAPVHTEDAQPQPQPPTLSPKPPSPSQPEPPSPSPRTILHRAEIRLPGQEPFMAEFYEGWWDRRTARPGFWTVFVWLLQIAPMALLNTGVLWCADRLAEMRVRSPRAVLSAFLPAALFIAWAPLAVVILPLILLVTAAVPRWRRFVQNVVVDAAGDAWLYRSKELDADVLPHLMRITERAAARSDRTVMVGHSQGAELSRRVGLRLQRDASLGTAVCRFVWAGSGENQLTMVRALARSPLVLLLLWPYVLAWPVVTHLLGTVLIHRTTAAAATLTTGSDWGAAVAHAAVAVSAILAGAAWVAAGVLAIRVLANAPRDAGLLPRGLSWYVQSVLDPVSFGSAGVRARREDPQATRVRYVPVDRSRPWWFEHISYFSKHRTGEVLLEAAMDAPEPLRAPHRPVVPWWVIAASAAGTVLAVWVSATAGGWMLQVIR